MKVTVPNYFSTFHCIADKCPSTCCAGWEVVVDPESKDRYQALKGKLGDRIRKEMTEIDGETCFQTLPDGRCPFLNKKNLCDIQAARGEEALCQTCHLYPRFINSFGGSEEMGLSLSCPEAARIIFNRRGKLTLVTEDHPEIPIQLTDMDAEIFMGMKTLRASLFEIAALSAVPMNHRLILLLRLARKGGKHLDALPEELTEKMNPRELLPQLRLARVRSEKCSPLIPIEVLDTLLSLDILTDEWKLRLESTKKEDLTFSPLGIQFEENLLETFLYRYLARAAYPDADTKTFLGYAKLAVFSVLVLRMLGAKMKKHELIELTILFSREVEHDEENIEKLLQVFKKSKKYSEKAMIAALLD